MLITPSLVLAFAAIIIMLKLRRNTLRKLLGMHIALDIAVTVLMGVLLAGTYSGMTVAIAAGAIFSVALVVLRRIFGYARLTVINDHDHLLPAVRWVYYSGRGELLCR